eukprot:UN11473
MLPYFAANYRAVIAPTKTLLRRRNNFWSAQSRRDNLRRNKVALHLYRGCQI